MVMMRAVIHRHWYWCTLVQTAISFFFWRCTVASWWPTQSPFIVLWSRDKWLSAKGVTAVGYSCGGSRQVVPSEGSDRLRTLCQVTHVFLSERPRWVSFLYVGDPRRGPDRCWTASRVYEEDPLQFWRELSSMFTLVWTFSDAEHRASLERPPWGCCGCEIFTSNPRVSSQGGSSHHCEVVSDIVERQVRWGAQSDMKSCLKFWHMMQCSKGVSIVRDVEDQIGELEILAGELWRVMAGSAASRETSDIASHTLGAKATSPESNCQAECGLRRRHACPQHQLRFGCASQELREHCPRQAAGHQHWLSWESISAPRGTHQLLLRSASSPATRSKLLECWLFRGVETPSTSGMGSLSGWFNLDERSHYRRQDWVRVAVHSCKMRRGIHVGLSQCDTRQQGSRGLYTCERNPNLRCCRSRRRQDCVQHLWCAQCDSASGCMSRVHRWAHRQPALVQTMSNHRLDTALHGRDKPFPATEAAAVGQHFSQCSSWKTTLLAGDVTDVWSRASVFTMTSAAPEWFWFTSTSPRAHSISSREVPSAATCSNRPQNAAFSHVPFMAPQGCALKEVFLVAAKSILMAHLSFEDPASLLVAKVRRIDCLRQEQMWELGERVWGEECLLCRSRTGQLRAAMSSGVQVCCTTQSMGSRHGGTWRTQVQAVEGRQVVSRAHWDRLRFGRLGDHVDRTVCVESSRHQRSRSSSSQRQIGPWSQVVDFRTSFPERFELTIRTQCTCTFRTEEYTLDLRFSLRGWPIDQLLGGQSLEFGPLCSRSQTSLRQVWEIQGSQARRDRACSDCWLQWPQLHRWGQIWDYLRDSNGIHVTQKWDCGSVHSGSELDVTLIKYPCGFKGLLVMQNGCRALCKYPRYNWVTQHLLEERKLTTHTRDLSQLIEVPQRTIGLSERRCDERNWQLVSPMQWQSQVWRH